MENDESKKPLHTVSPQVFEVYEPPKGYYKPCILRFPSLGLLLLITLSFIGLIEYAIHVLPAANSTGLIEGIFQASHLEGRQNYANNYTSAIITTVQGTLKTLAVTYVDPCTGTASCAPPPQYWLPVGTVTMSTSENSVPTSTTFTMNPTSAPPPQYWLSTGTVTLSSTQTPLPTTTTLIPPTAPAPQFWLTTGTELVYVFTSGQYFLGAFLSTLLAVLFALPWAIIDAKVRHMEPFHQLAKPRGALASATLCMDYLSPFAIFAPFKAIFAGHWTPLMTSILNLSAILITPLAPEFISIRMEGNCDAQITGCIPSLSTFPAVGRVIQALLCLMAIAAVLLIFHIHRYSIGTFADPSSIAGLATLSHNTEVSSDFQQPLLSGPRKQPYKSLANKRYKLDFYIDQGGSRKYGFAPVAQATYQEALIQQGSLPTSQGIKQPFSRQQLRFSHPHSKSAIGLFFLLACLSALIIYYKVSYTKSGFESFMDSQGFGVRFLFTSVGVVVKLYWSSIFEVQISSIDPYHHLANGSSKAEDSILVPKYSAPVTALPPSLLHGHFFMALVACSAFLAEILTICLSNVHFNTSTTFTAYTVSTWLSISILAIMLVTLIAIIFRRQPSLPLKPTTNAAVLCYLSTSSLLDRFKDMTRLGTQERDRIVQAMDLRYGMWVIDDSAQGGLVTIDIELNR